MAFLDDIITKINEPEKKEEPEEKKEDEGEKNEPAKKDEEKKEGLLRYTDAFYREFEK